METKNDFYVVSVEDTIKYGIISAAIIGRIRWWCEYNEKNKVKDRFHIEHWWSGFMSSKVLSQQLGLSVKTVEKHLSSLLKSGVIIKGVFNKKGYDRTSWYRVNPFTPIEETIYSNRGNGYTPIEEMDILQMGKPIPVNPSIIKNVSQSVNPAIKLTNYEKKELYYKKIVEIFPKNNIIKLIESGDKNTLIATIGKDKYENYSQLFEEYVSIPF